MSGALLFAVWAAVFLVTVTVHEYAHGLAARALGDPTAEQLGRLTLNPLKHIDPLWTLALPMVLFFGSGGRFALGMAKPVPVNFARLRRPRRDMIWVALAGPAANVALGGLLASVYRLWSLDALLLAVYFNFGIAVFNLIPVPPLDGSRVLAGLLPRAWALSYLSLEAYGILIVFALHFLGILARLVLPGMNALAALFGVPTLG